MTTEATQTDDIDDEIIVTLSDYLDGVLPADKKTEVEHKIANDAQWKTAHTEMVETRQALSGLQKAHAPVTFAEDVTSTIHKRSAGRFFGRRTFGDRVPFGAILIVAMLGLAVIAYVLWSSPTGTLKVNKEKPPQAGSSVIDEGQKP